MKKIVVLAAMSAVLLFASAGYASQFPTLDPGYGQQIYTGPLVGGPGMAWTSGGNLLTRNGFDILEYSLTQDASHQGTPIHSSIATHTVSGLSSTGYGMVSGLDGYIYTTTGAGLQRFNPNNWAAPAQSLAGTVGGAGYGITVLPDGRIAYSDGSGSSSVYIYNPSSGTNSWIYTAGFLIDDIEASATGEIALAGQSNSSIAIIDSSGTLVNSFLTAHYPDGLAFGDGAMSSALFANNNDGTITRYVLGAGYSGIPAVTDIAVGSGAYGDLASVGPDCAFYVTQFDNGGYHGSTPGVGTHWDNGVTNNEPSIIRIAAIGTDGNEICGFHYMPEPSSLALLGLGGLAMLRRKRPVACA
ncbi:MAG: PEP-CTERM sorting domain-containing protein [Planctomycetota bacterium]